MEPQVVIARRIAQELSEGMLVNLGIGIPTLVAKYVPQGIHVFFQSENGLIGTGAPPEEGMMHPTLTDAGGRPVTALPGASTFDSAMSFGLIRGGHVDLTVLGGLQVDQEGYLANWMIPGKMVPGMGGAMDLVTGAKRVIVAMQHTAKGATKIVKKCRLPVTSLRPIDMVVTEMAVITFRDGRATLVETAPGVSPAQVAAATEAELTVPSQVPVMALQ
jgi:acetate CoA/acetoacetate CoA-transferase beta subunit